MTPALGPKDFLLFPSNGFIVLHFTFKSTANSVTWSVRYRAQDKVTWLPTGRLFQHQLQMAFASVDRPSLLAWVYLRPSTHFSWFTLSVLLPTPRALESSSYRASPGPGSDSSTLFFHLKNFRHSHSSDFTNKFYNTLVCVYRNPYWDLAGTALNLRIWEDLASFLWGLSTCSIRFGPGVPQHKSCARLLFPGDLWTVLFIMWDSRGQ